jgi:hypothetical protein
VHLLEHLEDVDLVGLDALLGLLLPFLPSSSLSALDLPAGRRFSALGFFPTGAFSAFSVAGSSSAGFFSALGAIDVVLQRAAWGRAGGGGGVSIRSQWGGVR